MQSNKVEYSGLLCLEEAQESIKWDDILHIASRYASLAPSSKDSPVEDCRSDSDTTAEKGFSNTDSVTLNIHVNQQLLPFVLGKGGHTKRKIVNCTGVHITVFKNTMKIEGSFLSVCKAVLLYQVVVNKYYTHPLLFWCPIMETLALKLELPASYIPIFSTEHGHWVKTLELSYKVSVSVDRHESSQNSSIYIFGNVRNRYCSFLKLLSRIYKHHTALIDSMYDEEQVDQVPGFGVDILSLTAQERASVLGNRGQNIPKLQRSTGAILSVVGSRLFIAGTADERHRSREYVDMLTSCNTNIFFEKLEWRADQTVLYVKTSVFKESFGKTDLGRSELDTLQEQTKTIVFVQPHTKYTSLSRIFIISPNLYNRGMMSSRLMHRMEVCSKNGIKRKHGQDSIHPHSSRIPISH